MLIDIAPTDIQGLHLAGQPSTVLLRVFALQSFTSDDGLRIIQPGTPNTGPFYKEITCPVAGTTVSVPSLQLESQTDTFNPGERGARYYAAFYLPDGGFIAPFQPLSNFQIRHDYQPTSWPKVVSYNTAPYIPAGAYQTYTRGQIDGLFKLLPSTIDGGGAVNTVFGRDGDVVALAGDYDIPKITGLQSALDSKAGLPHYHDASALTSGLVDPARLGTGSSITTKFLRGDGTWQTVSSGPGTGAVSSVFGRVDDVTAQVGDYDIPKITGLSAALAAKADLPHYHDGSAITAGIVPAARLGSGLSGSGSTQFLRGDGVWATVTGTTGTLDTAANYTWTGTHLFKAIGGTFTVQGPAGKEMVGVQGDDGVSPLAWASLSLVRGTAAALIYDVDGTFNNRRSVRLDATAIHLRGAVLALEVSTDGTTFTQYAGTSFTGGNTAFNISATAAGSQSAGYTIGGLPALMQVYAGALFNTQALTGDLITQLVGKRYGFAFNAATRYSVMIDNDPADDAINTPLFIRYNGQLRRVVSDSSKVLSWAVLGGTPDATVFLRGDGVWATPAGTGPGGAVSSVGLTVDLTMFASPGPAVTSSGTLNVAFAPQTGPKILVGPGSGSAVPSFRLLTTTDIPPLDASAIATGFISPARLGTGPSGTNYLRSDGTWHDPPGGTGSGTVTSVGLSIPSSVFSLTVTGGGAVNPITVNGTFTLDLQPQLAVRVFAGPTAGNPTAAPTFRPLEVGDFPLLPANVIGSGVFVPARLGGGTSGTGTYLGGDSLWHPTSSLGSGGIGPISTLAAFDNASGAMITSLTYAPADYDYGAWDGVNAIGNIHFRHRGLLLDSGTACSTYYSNGNVGNVFYMQDDWMLIGPYNGTAGPSSPLGIRVNFRVGTGSAGDGSARGDLYLDGRSSGAGLIATSGHAAANYNGWLGINYHATVTSFPDRGAPIAPTAPLTVSRNDNNSSFIHLRHRGNLANNPVGIWSYGLIGANERSLWSIVGNFSNFTDSTRTSQLDFYIVQNTGDLLKMRLQPASGPNNSGLWLSRYNDSPGSGPTEVVLQDSTTYPGYRYLMLPQ